MVRGFDLFGGTPQMYDLGNEYTPFVVGFTQNNTETNIIQRFSSYILLQLRTTVASSSEVTMVTNNMIDLTNVQYILMDINPSSGGTHAPSYAVCSTQKNGNHTIYDSRLAFSTSGRGIHLMDVSALTGNFYFRLHKLLVGSSGGSDMTTYRILTIPKA